MIKFNNVKSGKYFYTKNYFIKYICQYQHEIKSRIKYQNR